MKRTTMVTALAAIFGLALAGAIPALAQTRQPASQPSVGCPFHDQESMSYQDMDQRMGLAAHDECMGSNDHDQMQPAMGDRDRMMGRYCPGSGNLMRGMISAGNMMGFPRQP